MSIVYYNNNNYNKNNNKNTKNKSKKLKTGKSYRKKKHFKTGKNYKKHTKCQKKVILQKQVQRITPQNKKFLKSLGLRVRS